MTIHGKGNNYRYYLSVHDFCEGIVKIIEKGKKGEIYNIASEKKYKVIEVVKIIANYLKVHFKKNTKFVTDRPFNDKIYKINCNKLKKLNWSTTRELKDLPNICDWYKRNNKIFLSETNLFVI